MPIKSIEIAWLAGLLEGEASFRINEDGTAANIKLAMTDFDIVEKAKLIFRHEGPISSYNKENFKTIFIINICGDNAIQWMMTIYPLMSLRRKSKLYSIIQSWKLYKRQYKEVCINGHDLTILENVYFQDGIRKGCMLCRKENGKSNDKARRGKMPPEYYLSKLKGISLEEAKKLLEKMNPTIQ